MLRRREPARHLHALVPILGLGLGLTGAACGGSTSAPVPTDPDSRPPDDGADPDAPLRSLDPTPGTYRETCDGSGALALDFDHFLDLNDENQGARVFRRAQDGAPLRTIDLSAVLNLAPDDEGDLEDMARIGNRLFVITSHGRNTSGQIRPARYRFGELELSGPAPDLALVPLGSTSLLLHQLLQASRWTTPDPAVIAALDASSKLATATDPNLAPEQQGTNIEGLAADDAGGLLIGFRNPRPGGRAIVVRLANPSAVASGLGAPQFTGAASLDLGGLGIRGMAWSDEHRAVLVLAGPHDGGAPGPFRLYKWSGALTAAPVLAATLAAPANSAPEAVVPYPDTKDVQIVFDQGDALNGGTICKDVAAAERRFTDVIVHVD